MRLSTSDLLQLSQQAISAARQAGAIISQYSHRAVAVKTKIAGTSRASQVVTEVDLQCQESILTSLSGTCETYDLALLTEETPDDLKRLEKDFFWCIDPLDGTLPFIESTPGYAVSIALVSRDGTPHIGVIYDPVEDILYHAVKNQGAFRNAQRWQLHHPAPGQSLSFIADRSFAQHSLYSQTVTELKSIAREMKYAGLNTKLHGGAAMNACWVLEQAPACYFKFPKQQNGGGSLWDYAATACVCLEAGAVVSDIFGEHLDLNRPDSTFMNHRGILFSSDPEIALRIKEMYSTLVTSHC